MEIKPLHIHNAEICQDSRIILIQGSKPEDKHTRRTLGTLSWVYKPSDIPYGNWKWQSLLVIPVAKPVSN